MTTVDYGPCVHTLRRRLEAAEAEVARLRAVAEAFDSIAWMAEAYAEAGGSSGPEMRSYTEAMEARAALDAGEVPRG